MQRKHLSKKSFSVILLNGVIFKVTLTIKINFIFLWLFTQKIYVDFIQQIFQPDSPNFKEQQKMMTKIRK